MSAARTFVPLAFALVAFQGPASDCPPYLVGIGDLAGDEFLSFANAISADGSVVVGASNADDPNVPNDGNSAAWSHASQGLLFSPPCTDAPETLVGLGYPFTGVHPESNAKGVSPDGAFFSGDATYGPSVPTTFKPVLWRSPSDFQELERLPGHVSGSAFCVSDSVPPLRASAKLKARRDHRIVAGFSTTASNHAHRVPGALPVYWEYPSLTPVALPFPSGSSATHGEVRYTSRDGRVLAGNLYSYSASHLSVSTACAWVWRPGALAFEALDLGEPGRTSSWVSGMSEDGRVVTGFGLDDIDNDFGFETPCVWRGTGAPPSFAFGAPQVLPLLPGATGGTASGVTEDGAIVGGQNVIDFVTHAVRWSGANLANVEDVLTSAANLGVDTGSWTLWYVSDFAADGETMIGTGDRIDAQGNFVIEGWTARLPLL